MSRLNPTLWRTCRALANIERLQLLRLLFANSDGLSVSEMTSLSGLLMSSASMHLRVLNARGLITTRRKKNFVIYMFEPNENLEVAPNLLAALKEVFKTGSTNREIYDLCTAFTHHRRIEIVRLLHQAPMDYDVLSAKTNFSYTALYRHLSKLLVRGIIQKQKHLYSVAKSDNPLHNALIYAAVC